MLAVELPDRIPHSGLILSRLLLAGRALVPKYSRVLIAGLCLVVSTLAFCADRTAHQPPSPMPPMVELAPAAGALPLQDLRGPHNQAYYIHAPDRAPKPGELKYPTQGIVQLRGINLGFTVLTNGGQYAVVRAALDM